VDFLNLKALIIVQLEQLIVLGVQ